MPRFTLFRVFYSSTFTLLFLFLIVLLLIPAADGIAQAYVRNKQLYNVFVIAGCYLLTALLALAIYISRIYAFRRLLADIPKEYVPVRKLDLPKRVHSAVAGSLSRSALVTASARPREEPGVWGVVSHPGWARPGSELQGVQYAAVVNELPTVIESKAATLVVGGDEEDADVPPMLVRRRPDMTLRAYLDHLSALGLAPRDVVETFLDAYERARFRKTGRGIEEAEFRTLMESFAALLRGMDSRVQVEPDIRIEHEEERYPSTEGSEDGGRVRYQELYGGATSSYDTTTTDEGFGYVSERTDTSGGGHGGSIGTVGRRLSAAVSLPRPPRSTNTCSSSTSSRSGGTGFEMDELGPGGRRRLSLRASAGTFGKQ